MTSMEFTTPTPTTVCIVRSFDAPLELVWRAHTEPELVKQWMTGPPDHSLPVCEIDFRVGGKARYVWKNPEFEMGMTAEFKEIEPKARIVHTELFDGWPEGATLVTSHFAEEEGRTTITIEIEYLTQEARDAAMQPGFQEGYAASYATLDGLLANAVRSGRILTVKLKEALGELESLANEKMRAQNARNGAGENQFGVRLGDIRKVAKAIGPDHELALALWKTENIDARLLAILLMKPKALAGRELDELVRSVSFVQVADWLIAYVVKKHPDKESLRGDWMTADDPMAARAGWQLTAERVAKSPEGLDLAGLLKRIEAEMADANPLVQWTMNNTLAEIGIRVEKHRKRALSIGEKLGIYRDYPTSKGCTSPYAPTWIEAMVARQA